MKPHLGANRTVVVGEKGMVAYSIKVKVNVVVGLVYEKAKNILLTSPSFFYYVHIRT